MSTVTGTLTISKDANETVEEFAALRLKVQLRPDVVSVSEIVNNAFSAVMNFFLAVN